MHETDALMDAIAYAKALGLEALDAIKDEDDVGLSSIMKEMIERNF